MSSDNDVIVGAEYADSVFDTECTVVEVRAESDDDVADEDDIIVTLEYDDVFDDTIEVPLRAFTEDRGMTLLRVPDEDSESDANRNS